jgi:hypothetical protein
MRGTLPAIMLCLTAAGCATATAPETFTREEVAAQVDRATVDDGFDRNCIIDKALAGAPNAPLTVLNETPANAAQSRAIAHALRIGIAIQEATKVCPAAAAPSSGTP